MSPAVVVLADYNPQDVKPGWIALLIVAGLAVATFLLWRSMNTQLRRIKVPPDPNKPVRRTQIAQRANDESPAGQDVGDDGGDSGRPESSAN